MKRYLSSGEARNLRAFLGGAQWARADVMAALEVLLNEREDYLVCLSTMPPPSLQEEWSLWNKRRYELLCEDHSLSPRLDSNVLREYYSGTKDAEGFKVPVYSYEGK